MKQLGAAEISEMEHAASVVSNEDQGSNSNQDNKELPRRYTHEVTSLLAMRTIVKLAGWESRHSQERCDPVQDLLQDRSRNPCRLFRLPLTPVEAFQMICEDDSADPLPGGQNDFEGIPFWAASYGAYDCEVCFLVVCARSEDKSGPASRLLTTRLRCKIQPDEIARVRHVAARYHNSLPTGSPQSVSEWIFSARMPRKSSSSVGFFFDFRMLTEPGPSTANSSSSPGRSFAASATGLGIRKAMLLPHFAN
jgi:hypothetical protein